MPEKDRTTTEVAQEDSATPDVDAVEGTAAPADAAGEAEATEQADAAADAMSDEPAADDAADGDSPDDDSPEDAPDDDSPEDAPDNDSPEDAPGDDQAAEEALDRTPEPVAEPATEPAGAIATSSGEPAPTAPAPAERPEETAGQRLRRALMRPSRKQVVAGVLLALVGFAAVTQVRVAGTDENYASLREQELIDVLNALAGTRQRTEAEIARLEEVAAGLRDDTTSRQTALDQAEEQADSLNILAGLVPVTGPGIKLTITEESGRVRLSSMLDTIQELRTVGAEAIAINGVVRVVAQTSFVPTEGGFLVDGERIEPPYVIDVIGEPGVLSAAIDFPLGPRKQLEDDGATIEVRELGTVDIDAVTRRDEPRYAQPDQGQ